MTLRVLHQSNSLEMTMDDQQYPAGWDAERVRRVMEHYESQTDEEGAEEDETAFKEYPPQSIGIKETLSVNREDSPIVNREIARNPCRSKQ